MTEQQPQTEEINLKGYAVIGLRFVQLLAACMAIVGAIWGSSDFVMSLLPASSVVTPTSVLLMLYGFVGTAAIECAIRWIRWVSRKK